MWIVSLTIGIVVQKTITEKIIVQSGSAHLYFGSNLMIIDDVRTPTDWIKSPRTCMIAALMLICCGLLSYKKFDIEQM